jgi:hypothetical protein
MNSTYVLLLTILGMILFPLFILRRHPKYKHLSEFKDEFIGTKWIQNL